MLGYLRCLRRIAGFPFEGQRTTSEEHKKWWEAEMLKTRRIKIDKLN